LNQHRESDAMQNSVDNYAHSTIHGHTLTSTFEYDYDFYL